VVPEPEFDPCDAFDDEAPTRFEQWRRRTATGVVLSAIALGLREALEGPRDKPAIVQEYEEDPIREDDPIELHMEWGSPADTWVVVRPWLLRGGGPGRGAGRGAAGAGRERPWGAGPGRS
jgi:hypothetical protein